MPLGTEKNHSPEQDGEMRDLHSLTRGELAELLSSLGQPSFRAKQGRAARLGTKNATFERYTV